MRLNDLQKLITLLFCIALAVSAFYPPWIRIIGHNGLETAIGFSSVFLPPDFPAVKIDFARLILLWVAIAATTAVALLIAGRKGRS